MTLRRTSLAAVLTAVLLPSVARAEAPAQPAPEPGATTAVASDATTPVASDATTPVPSDATTPAAVPAAPAASADPRAGWRYALYGSLALTAAGVVTSYYAYRQVDEAEAGLCTGRHQSEPGCVPASDRAEVANLNDRGNFFSAVSSVSQLVVLVGVVASGVSLYEVLSTPKGPARTAAILPLVSPTTAGAAVSLRW